MNVAGPSRRAVPPGQLAFREGVESAYERDLLALINRLSLDEVNEMQTFFAYRVGEGEQLSDHDVAMNELLQQAQALAVLDEARMLAQHVAADGSEGEDVGAEPTGRLGVQTLPRIAVLRRNHRRNGAASSPKWRRWVSSVMGRVFGSQPPSQPGSTNITPPRRPAANCPTGHDSVICQDPIHGAEIRAPYGHYYDMAHPEVQCAIGLQSLKQIFSDNPTSYDDSPVGNVNFKPPPRSPSNVRYKPFPSQHIIGTPPKPPPEFLSQCLAIAHHQCVRAYIQVIWDYPRSEKSQVLSTEVNKEAVQKLKFDFPLSDSYSEKVSADRKV